MANYTCHKSPLHEGWGCLISSVELQCLFGVTALVLLVSLVGNITCCVQRYKKRESVRSPRQARTSVTSSEEAPLYSNLRFLQEEALVAGETVSKPEPSAHRAPKPQKMCYANLKVMKPAAVQQVTDSSIQYADVVTLLNGEPLPTAPGKDPGKQKRAAPRAVEAQDPLYASVQTDRYKTQFEDLDYANNN
ncbi:signaling threshold-regulating transmembrane adapter 1-like [Lissotriton helveticus]